MQAYLIYSIKGWCGSLYNKQAGPRQNKQTHYYMDLWLWFAGTFPAFMTNKIKAKQFTVQGR